MGEARIRAQAAAGAGVPLGINAKSSARGPGVQGKNRKLASRGILYRLADVVRWALFDRTKPPEKQHRACRCHFSRNAATVEIRYDRKRGRAHFGRGMESCSNVWVCPVCSGRITEERRRELQLGVNRWKEQGGEVYLLTLTFPHVRTDRLEALVEGLRLAHKKFGSCPAMKRVRKECGHIGSIKALEVTWSDWHGWHPHVHVLWFAKPGQEDVIKRLAPAWAESVVRAGLADRSQLNNMLTGKKLPSGKRVPAAFDVQNGDYAAEYVAKWGREPSLHSKIVAGSTQGIAREMVSGQSKVSRRLSGVTPFTLLAVIAGITEVEGLKPGQALALFSEFASAFAHERQLYWSPGLRKTLNVSELFTDEQIAASEDLQDESESAAVLNADDFRVMVTHRAWDPMLRAVEETQGGDRGVRSLLAALRALPPPVRARGAVNDVIEAGERRMWPRSNIVTYQTPDGGTGYFTEKVR